MQKHTYYVKGMHCASCEILIEKELLSFPSVELADATLTNGQVNIGFKHDRPSLEKLNELFRENGYVFSDHPFPKESSDWLKPILWAGLIITIFILVIKLGLASFVSVNSQSSLGVFFIFGLLAGISGCAALIGGLVLSLSKQWLEMYSPSASLTAKMIPHTLFNVGRIISYGLLGLALGFLGERIQFSPVITAVIVLAVSGLMLLLALQMMGVKTFSRLRIALPKNLTGKIYAGERKGGWFYPLFVGFLTVLLPCGFTIIAEGAAILSGSPWRGLLIMFFFVLGTMLPLMAIGASSVKLGSNQKSSEAFLKTAGLLIIFFIIFNLNTQFGLVRYLSNFISNLGAVENLEGQSGNNALPIPDTTQVIKAIYSDAKGLNPNSFTIKVGQPVRLEIEVKDDVYGCMSTILIPGLWDQPELMRKGKTVVMEFTVRRSDTFPITCAMGVPWGTIKAIY
ncbi:MAG: sulfite exporter TauE/SafE family protein [Patescibacteria group bacterium]|jgi:sulfite exporter TauE/SafE/copper chaperone CopZ